MKSLKQIREAKSGGKEAYQKFFNSLLKKFGVSSPSELKGDDKKKFYDELDAGWESDDPNDKNERYEDPDNLDPETDVDSDEDMADKAASKVTEAKESNYPKPLSIIRSNKLSDDALEEAYDMNEKMVMCEHCGKMHEEGACGESYDSNSLDPETKGMKENKMLGNMDTALASLSKKPEYKKISKNLMSLSKRAAERDKGAPKQLRTQLASLASKVDKKAGAALMKMSKLAGTYESVEEVEEANRFSKKLNKPSKKIYDLALAAIRRNNVRGKKDQDEYVDDVAGVSLTAKEVELVKQAIQHESVEEAVRQGKKIKGAKLGKAYPVLDLGTQRKVKAIAKKHSGDMERALKDIEKLKKGLGDNPDVMDILRKANETYDYGSDKAVKAAKKKTPGQKNEGVDVDRRTKGFKEAMKRAEAAKKKREAYKKKKEAKKDQAELDARYDYDGEVDTVLALSLIHI